LVPIESAYANSVIVTLVLSCTVSDILQLLCAPDSTDVPNVKKFASFSDSLSSLLAINNRHFETGYVQKFITDYSQLSNSGKIIILIWIPGHIGIRGNE